MDTSTHVVMGIGLGGIAMLDPVVAGSPVTSEAIVIGTLVGSLMPDFDTLFKLKDNAAYIRQHRGLSHSIPAVMLWPLIISGVITSFLPDAAGLHLWLWTFAAVVLHVFVDIFNAYGTQALRPFSDRWVALGIINIFDPVIFLTHAAGILIWIWILAAPGIIFISVYVLLFFYYLWRISAHRLVGKRVRRKIPEAEYVNLSPTFSWNRWHVSVRTPTKFYVASARKDDIVILDEYEREPVPQTPLMETVKQDDNVQAFLAFSPIHRWETTEFPLYREIRFIDLRYRNKNGHYPFVAIVLIDEEDQVASSFTGWVHSEAKLQKKLQLAMN
ncbi:MAG TPA: metal-dependent hydrolase [Bacillales bacterium]|nr:metal-dependent hydrolase [Bacillales bacterium]